VYTGTERINIDTNFKTYTNPVLKLGSNSIIVFRELKINGWIHILIVKYIPG